MTRDLEMRGFITLKLGFSVVAAIRVIIPDSTAPRSESCWALENRCISSRNNTVGLSKLSLSALASLMTSLTCETELSTALSSTYFDEPVWEIILASVVLPLPGGPQSSTELIDFVTSPETSRASGELSASAAFWPTKSLRVLGLSLSANGGCDTRRLYSST